MNDFIIDVKLTSDQASFMAKTLTVYSAYKREESLKSGIEGILKELAIIIIGKESDAVLHIDIDKIPIIYDSMNCYCYALSHELQNSTYKELMKMSEDIISVINARAVACVDTRFGVDSSEVDVNAE